MNRQRFEFTTAKTAILPDGFFGLSIESEALGQEVGMIATYPTEYAFKMLQRFGWELIAVANDEVDPATGMTIARSYFFKRPVEDDEGGHAIPCVDIDAD